MSMVQRAYGQNTGFGGASLRLLKGDARLPATLWTQTEDPGDHDDLCVSSEARRFISNKVRVALLPWDHLPYTEQFELIVAEFLSEGYARSALQRIACDNVKHGVWLLGTRIRKAGEATPFSPRDETPPMFTACSPSILQKHIPFPLSQRDRLPYSVNYTDYRRSYNKAIASTQYPQLDDREFWQAILTTSKRMRSEDSSNADMYTPDKRGAAYPSLFESE